MNESLNKMVQGQFIRLQDEEYYVIRHVDKMPPFFINLVSDNDLWMFIASNGGLTAGRVSPDSALFPYVTVDKIYDSVHHSGSKTIIRLWQSDSFTYWEPFNREKDGLFHTERHLYKSLLGNSIIFEEINHDLGLRFSYRWMSSASHGLVRYCELENSGEQTVGLEILDGLVNIQSAGTPQRAQNQSSYLVDAYKWNELDEVSGLAMYTLFSGISDRAEPLESLKANIVCASDLQGSEILLSTEQLDRFRKGKPVVKEKLKRGIRGAYLVHRAIHLDKEQSCHWSLVADMDLDQVEVLSRIQSIRQSPALFETIMKSVDQGSDKLARIMASADAFQVSAEKHVSSHHYSNVLFNVLRGGVFPDQYRVDIADFLRSIKNFNRPVYHAHKTMLSVLPSSVSFDDLKKKVAETGDLCLIRLFNEYLPITFGRRHGDPSRPWNQFAIELKDRQGNDLLTYQGNWRDIFQNWEALAISFPEYIESMIAKFVNASTMDGYNPYRITKEGIDWEVEDPEDPWSYIGYWGDHQIIYLLKLLELSDQFHPGRLNQLLRETLYSYANVPYRIKPLASLINDAKDTVVYDEAAAEIIEQRCQQIGQDGKLVLDENDTVYQVNLLEKLLVPMLSKLGNLVIGGGIWMNTQRPEWNDANNALVGQGLSMVTLYYLRRYIRFMEYLLEDETERVMLTQEVTELINHTAQDLSDAVDRLEIERNQLQFSYVVLIAVGESAGRFREAIYAKRPLKSVVVFPLLQIKQLFKDALVLIDHSIDCNRRIDGLYHAYNLIDFNADPFDIHNLYLMLEGQVAVLSSGKLEPQEAVSVIQQLFESDIYRADQKSFLLYPDRQLPGFLQKNIIPESLLRQHPALQSWLNWPLQTIILQDEAGNYRFDAQLTNADQLEMQLEALAQLDSERVDAARAVLLKAYETVFNHQAFTGRSGGMFGFEGLGCIYWHMVSKLLLAVQENFFHAIDADADHTIQLALASLYYRVREGIGFNKTPQEYGAFPVDPYSHTPSHAGAQQPGMTGQVKEEILTRFGELGFQVRNGKVKIQPQLLRTREFSAQPLQFRYLDIHGEWNTIDTPQQGLAFSWCQVPIIYQLDTKQEQGAVRLLIDEHEQVIEGLEIPGATCREIFARSGRVRQIVVTIPSRQLLLE